MIDVKTAIRSVQEYIANFRDIFPTTDMRLEETELKDNEALWLITMSVVTDVFTGNRIYKQFRIDAQTGEVLAMKNR